MTNRVGNLNKLRIQILGENIPLKSSWILYSSDSPRRPQAAFPLSFKREGEAPKVRGGEYVCKNSPTPNIIEPNKLSKINLWRISNS